MNPCPVCGATLIIDVSHLDYGTECERYEDCTACGYAYEFAYGNSSEAIGDGEIHRCWSDGAGDSYERRENERQQRLDLIRRRRAVLAAEGVIPSS